MLRRCRQPLLAPARQFIEPERRERPDQGEAGRQQLLKLLSGVIEAVGAAVFGTEFRELVIYATFILILIVVPIVVRIVKRSREAKAQRRIQYERSAA